MCSVLPQKNPPMSCNHLPKASIPVLFNGAWQIAGFVELPTVCSQFQLLTASTCLIGACSITILRSQGQRELTFEHKFLLDSNHAFKIHSWSRFLSSNKMIVHSVCCDRATIKVPSVLSLATVHKCVKYFISKSQPGKRIAAALLLIRESKQQSAFSGWICHG